MHFGVLIIVYVVEFKSPFRSRPDTLDPALLRPGRMDRKVEFGLPDLEVSEWVSEWVGE